MLKKPVVALPCQHDTGVTALRATAGAVKLCQSNGLQSYTC